MKFSIIIPAHNEEENIPVLMKNLLTFIKRKKLKAEIILIDDNSTDSTPEICEKFAKEYDNVYTIHRTKNRGMGNSLKEGTRQAKTDVIVWLMADLADDLNIIPKFLDKIKNGADMVFGSRYVKDGSSGDLSLFKRIASNGFSLMSRLFIGIEVHDITNAFRVFRKEVFNSLELESGGFGISPEFALKVHLAGYKLDEVPTVYSNRKRGTAKFKMLKMAKRYFNVFLWALARKLKIR